MKNIFALRGIGDYLLQVSLIILSLVIATGINRCNENRKDSHKLAFYLSAIEEELTRELKVNRMNLNDAERDLEAINSAIRLSRSADPDSLQASLQNGLAVFVRGVFRTFKATTFDLMAQTNDLLLLEDLEYRNQLAYVSAFRDDYLKEDLRRHDDMTYSSAEKMGQYVDLACARETGGDINCLIDAEGYRKYAAGIWLLLLRETQLRAFHLQNAIESTEAALEATKAQRP